MSKLVLGTVQFGIRYGINNTVGQVSKEEVCKILEIAEKRGISMLDTSSAYGESEAVLGEALMKTSTTFNIVSKYPRCAESVRNTFENSCKKLGTGGLYGYLVHNFDFFQERPEIFVEMTHLKDEGRIQKVGFSLYNVEQLQFLLDKGIRFDIIQFPYNIFDRQFESYMPELYKNGVEIHTRSVFLQGLFFKDTSTLPEKLKPLKKYLDSLQMYCRSHNMTVEQLALGYVLANPLVRGVLIGVDNHEQLEANVQTEGNTLSEEDINCINDINVSERWLLSPVNWN